MVYETRKRDVIIYLCELCGFGYKDPTYLDSSSEKAADLNSF